MLLLSFTNIMVAIEANTIIQNNNTKIESILEQEDYNLKDKNAIYMNDYHRDQDQNNIIQFLRIIPMYKLFDQYRCTILIL